MTLVLRRTLGEGTLPQVALDPRSRCGVRAGRARSLQGVTLEEDLEEVASIGGSA
jgi:hypothetical protein